MIRRRVHMVLLASALLAVGLVPATGRVWAGPVAVEADSVSYAEDGKVVSAQGNVRVNWGQSSFEARSVVYEQEAGQLEVTGPLRLETPDLTASAAACRWSIVDETGSFTDVFIEDRQEGLRFGGASVEKRLGLEYGITDGYVTTCMAAEGKRSDWDISADSLDIDLDGYGRLRGGVFRIKGVPLVYLPYGVFPTRRHRHSGLLVPHFGTSNERGFTFYQPLYWAIDKHSDATLIAKIETEARMGVGLEYRYHPDRSRHGRVKLAYVNEQVRGRASGIVSPLFVGKKADDNRGKLDLVHRQRLSPSTSLYADLLVVTDDLYLREVTSDAERGRLRQLERSLRYTDARVGLVSSRGFTSFGAQMSGYRDLVGDEGLTLQNPARYWASSDRSLGAYALTADLRVDAFRRGRGSDGERLLATLGAERPVLPGRAASLRLWGKGRVAAYRMEVAGATVPGGASAVADDPVRFIGSFGADASLSLARSFGDLRHTVRPFAGLRYTSPSGDRDLPLYDALDRVDGGTVFRYGFGSRLLSDPAGGERKELAAVSLSQSYDLDERVIDDHFSDVDMAVRVSLSQRLSIRTLASYNLGSDMLTGAITSLGLHDIALPGLDNGGSSLALAYRYVRGGLLESAEGRIDVPLMSRVGIALSGRYDLAGDEFVERAAGVKIGSSCDCWALDIGYVERVNPDEGQLRVLVELSGLGDLGSSISSTLRPSLEGIHASEASFVRSGW